MESFVSEPKLKQESYKLLGKKLKRFKSLLTSSNNIKNIQNAPIISESTLLQINKIIKNKSKNNESSIPPDYILPPLSLKEQYEELLNRNELILPPKYKLLLKKQNYLDSILSENSVKINNVNNNNNNNLNPAQNIHLYNDIQNEFKKKTNMDFNNSDFQQILFIGPFYYIYQSISKLSKGIEIKCIDIPNDYIQRMNKKYNLKTNFTLMQTPKLYEPINGEINMSVLEKRKQLFKKFLINITVEQHKQFLKENNLPFFDPVKLKTWHHSFDLKNVNDMGYYDLVENNIKEYKKLIIR